MSPAEFRSSCLVVLRCVVAAGDGWTDGLAHAVGVLVSAARECDDAFGELITAYDAIADEALPTEASHRLWDLLADEMPSTDCALKVLGLASSTAKALGSPDGEKMLGDLFRAISRLEREVADDAGGVDAEADPALDDEAPAPAPARHAAHAALDGLLDYIGEERVDAVTKQLHALHAARLNEDVARAALEAAESRVEEAMVEISKEWEELRFVIEAAPGMVSGDREAVS